MKTRLTLLIVFGVSLCISLILSLSFYRTLPQAWQVFWHASHSHLFLILAIALAVALQLLGHFIRAYKHKLLLDQIRSIELYEVFKGQMIGFLFNVLLPLRLGELVRAHYIGKGVLISRSAVFATIVFERLVDLTIISSLGLIAIPLAIVSIISMNFIWLVGGTLLAGSIIAIVLYLARSQDQHFLRLIYHTTAVFNEPLRDRGRLVAWSFIYCLKNVIVAPVTSRYIRYSIGMWAAYLGSMAIIILEFLSLSGRAAFVGSITAFLSVSTPLGPTYATNFVKQFSAVWHQPLLQPAAHILLVGCICWLILVVPSSILGIIYLLQKQHVKRSRQSHPLTVMKNKLYRDTDISTEFGHFLDAYFQGAQLNIILNNHETARTFTVIKTFKGGSNALTLLAWQNGAMVVKKITLPQFADKLSAQYQWLAERSQLNHIARVVGEQHYPDHYAIDIEYREEFVPFFDTMHASDQTTSWQNLRKICKFMQNKVYEITPINDQRQKLDAYITEKVVGKVVDAANTSLVLSKFLAYRTIFVNGQEMPNFNQILKKIQDNKRAMRDLQQFSDSPIHGDLTIDNIIINPTTQEYLLLDPNNENAISDPVTDYGKLFQSLHSGYEFLVLLKKCEVRRNRCTFEEKKSVQYNYLYQKLSEYLAGTLSEGQYRSILFHEAVHYCRMLTYRANIDPSTVVAFYCVAIRLFNEFLQQYDRKM